MKYARKGKPKRKDIAENNLNKDREFNKSDPQIPLLPRLRLFAKNNHDIETSHTISPKTSENIFKISQISDSLTSSLANRQYDPSDLAVQVSNNENDNEKKKISANLDYYHNNRNLDGYDYGYKVPDSGSNKQGTSFLSTSENILKKRQTSILNDNIINKNKKNTLSAPLVNKGISNNIQRNSESFIELKHEKERDLARLNLIKTGKVHTVLPEPMDLTLSTRKNSPKNSIGLGSDRANREGNKSKSSTNTKINLYTNDDISRILKSANADAMSLSSNIFFDKDKLNLRTTSGFALLIHELTHINQLKNHGSLYPVHSNTNKSIPSSLNSYWEKEALDNENLTIRYIQAQSLKRNKSYIANNTINENYFGSNSSNAKIPTVFSNNHSVAPVIRDDEYSNDNRDLNLDKIRDKITRLLEPVLVEPQNFDYIDTQLNTYSNDLFNTSNSKIKISNPILGLTDYADMYGLGYAKNFNLSPSNFSYENNAENKIGPSNILYEGNKSEYQASDNLSMLDSSHSSSFPMFAESNRSVDSLASSTESGQNQVSPAFANIDDTSRSQQPNIVDLELISEKVYQIIQSKIKIQKARIGIR